MSKQEQRLIEDVLSCNHTVRVLKKAGIHTVEQLEKMTDEELLKIRGVGKVIAHDVRMRLEELKSDDC